jgi:hypothetical protein
MCNVCVPLYLFCFIKNLFAVINCTRLKYTFGIRAIIGFKGTPLWLGVWLRFCDKPCYNGRSAVLIL